MLKIMMATLLIALAGCATTKTYLPLNPAGDATSATVHLIRDSDEAVFPIHAFIDGQLAATIIPESFASFSVPAGEHLLRLQWPKADSSHVEQRIVFAAGQTRYFQIAPDSATDPVMRQVVPVIGALVLASKQSEMPIQCVEATADWGQRVMKELGGE